MKFEFSTFKTVASCSLMMFANFNLSAQEIFKIDKQSLKNISNDYYVYGVELKTITDSSTIRKGYIVIPENNLPIDSEDLKGDYKEISSTMAFSDEGVPNEFLKNELSEKVRKHFGYSNKISTLIEQQNTKKLYVLDYGIFEKIINNIKNEESQKNTELFLQSLGYKIYTENNLRYLKTKYYQVQCNELLINTLKKNSDYLKNIDSYFEQLQSLRKQALGYNSKFDKYIRLYRLQRNRMSKADIVAWTTLTKSALELNKKFVIVNDKLWGDPEKFPLSENYIKNSTEFDNYLGTSRGVLGL
jgi:hypothetical protein